MQFHFPIAELRRIAADALEACGYVPGDSGRVRAVPDTRTIRYYTTLGLIDRPVAMRGRTALYGRRHVLQIVAIKTLQSSGKTLSHIQAELEGLSDRQLADTSGMPDAFWQTVRVDRKIGSIDPQPEMPEAAAFWAAPAATPSPIPAQTDLTGGGSVKRSPTAIVELPLGDGVVVRLNVHADQFPDVAAMDQFADEVAPELDAVAQAVRVAAVRRGWMPDD